MHNRVGNLYLPGKVPYQQAWRWQQQLVTRYKQALMGSDVQAPDREHDPKDKLILLEHPPVYTLGQGSAAQFLKFDPDREDYELYRTERGGEVTYHCPGQLVGYPILNLKQYQMDLHWYLRQLEEVLIRTLACYGLKGDRIPGLTGVWVRNCKVAAIGIKVSRWITMHGFALNVCPDLSGFERIVPCGIEDKPVGSMAQFMPDTPDTLDLSVEAVCPVLVEQFEQVFGLALEAASSSELEQLAS